MIRELLAVTFLVLSLLASGAMLALSHPDTLLQHMGVVTPMVAPSTGAAETRRMQP